MNIFIVNTIVIIINITSTIIIIIIITEEIEIFTKRNYFATRCGFDATGRIINILSFNIYIEQKLERFKYIM